MDRTRKASGWFRLLTLLLALCFFSCQQPPPAPQPTPTVAAATPAATPKPLFREKSTPKPPPLPKDPEQLITNLLDTEDWIFLRSKEIKQLSHGIKNLELPGPAAEQFFRPDAMVLDIGETPRLDYRLSDLEVEAFDWPAAEQARELGQQSLWSPVLAQIHYFEQAKFKIVSAHTLRQDKEVTAFLLFEGLARDSEGTLLQVTAKQDTHWLKTDEGEWRLVEWTQRSLHVVKASAPMFVDVVPQVLAEPVKEVAESSPHEELMETLDKPPFKGFSSHAADRHPSVSVVDIDQDGFDDLYVMARWGKNLLLRNKGDGTFEEIAAKHGLDIEDHCSTAIFADFDNDGDPDLMLGRTLARSMYLRNDNGRFVDCSKSHVAVELPYLVFSISAADYNGDGLLDVLLNTYAQELMGEIPPEYKKKRWLAKYLTEEQARHLFSIRRRNLMYDRPGPPNLLLLNKGRGKFTVAPENPQLEAWSHTTQATWSDMDDDGDPDLYMSNDFAENLLFRNDGEAGFVDITKETDTADIGFGMGVAWGDYDLDGQFDLYVSNMFSKAGQRITAKLSPGDTRVTRMSRGNTLFRRQDDGFEKVSGLKPPALQVEKVGWSWSGQFVDVNNDGFLDIHALSGFYTAPHDRELPGDL